MTTTDQATVNGQAPAGAEQPPGDPDAPAAVPASERVMGIFGIALGAVILGIGLDMLTGGRFGLAGLLSALGARAQEAGDGDGG